MANILTLDLDFGVLEQYRELSEEVEKEIQKAVTDLSAAAHAHIVEEASHKLHSLQEQFITNLPPPEEIEKGVWLIRIPGKDDPDYEDISWIDDGIPNNFDMKPGLLTSDKAKTGKNGKYIVVPFKHNKKPTQQSAAAKTLAKSILNEMSKRGISKSQIEKNPDGSPKLGTLHKFDIQGPKPKNQVGPPQQGPQGRQYRAHPRDQGQEGPGGRPFSWGVRVVQRKNNETGGIERNVLTFRTVSEKSPSGSWTHPGLEGLHSIEEAYKWAENEFETTILPQLITKFNLG